LPKEPAVGSNNRSCTKYHRERQRKPERNASQVKKPRKQAKLLPNKKTVSAKNETSGYPFLQVSAEIRLSGDVRTAGFEKNQN
jgi:hypothetical protein